MKVVLLIQGIGFKNDFFQISFEKLYRQNDDRDIVILSKFFIENPHKVDPHQNKFFLIKNKTILKKKIKLYYSKFPPKMPFHACFSYINKHLLIILNITIINRKSYVRTETCTFRPPPYPNIKIGCILMNSIFTDLQKIV